MFGYWYAKRIVEDMYQFVAAALILRWFASTLPPLLVGISVPERACQAWLPFTSSSGYPTKTKHAFLVQDTCWDAYVRFVIVRCIFLYNFCTNLHLTWDIALTTYKWLFVIFLTQNHWLTFCLSIGLVIQDYLG